MDNIDEINKQYSEKESELLQINNNRIKILKSQLTAKEEELAEYKSKLERDKQVISTLQEEAASYNSILKEYEDKFQEFKALLNEKNLIIEKLSAEKEEFEKDNSQSLKELKIKCETQCEKSKTLSETVQSLRWEIDTQKRNYEQKLSECISKINIDRNAADREISQKEADMKESTQRIIKQADEKIALIKAELEKKCTSLEYKLSSRENEITMLTEDKNKLANNNSVLKETLDNLNQNSREKLSALSKEKDSIQDKLSRVNDEKDQLQHTLRSQLDEAKRSLRDITQEKMKYESELKCLKEVHSYEIKSIEETKKIEIAKNCLKLEGDIKSMQQELLGKEKEIERLRQENEDKYKDLEEAKIKIWKESTNISKSHQRTIEEYENKIQDLKTQLLHSSFENKRLNENLKTMEEIETQKTEEFKSLIKKYNSANQNIEDLKNQLFKSNASNRRNEQEIDNLKSPMKSDLETENDQLKEIIEKMKLDMEQLQKMMIENNKNKATIQEMKSKGASEAMLREANKKIEQISNELSQCNTMLKNKEKMIFSLEAQLNTSEKNLADAEATIKKLTFERERLLEVSNNLKIDLKANAKEIQLLRNQLSSEKIQKELYSDNIDDEKPVVHTEPLSPQVPTREATFKQKLQKLKSDYSALHSGKKSFTRKIDVDD